MYREQWESGIVFIKRLHALGMRDPWHSHTGVVESSLKWYVVSIGSAFIFRVRQAAIFIYTTTLPKWGWRSFGASPSLWLLLVFVFRTLWLEAPSPNWRLPRGYHHHHSCEQNGWTTGGGRGISETLRGNCGGNRPTGHISVVSVQMLFVSRICKYKEHTWIRWALLFIAELHQHGPRHFACKPSAGVS